MWRAGGLYVEAVEKAPATIDILRCDMSASSIALGVNGQPSHGLLVNRVLMHDCDSVRGDKENWGYFRARSKWPVWALFLQPR
jgi:hypothetical protein